jgi:hypothetical protein
MNVRGFWLYTVPAIHLLYLNPCCVGKHVKNTCGSIADLFLEVLDDKV